MTSLWIVTNSEGADLACNLRAQAMEHAAEMAADFPQFAPWNVTEYVPARDLAATKAETRRIILSANEAAAILGDQCEKMEEERDDALRDLAAAKALLRDIRHACPQYQTGEWKARFAAIDAAIAGSKEKP